MEEAKESTASLNRIALQPVPPDSTSGHLNSSSIGEITNEMVAETIKETIEKAYPGSTVLLIILTGSRAKGLESPGSDFDSKCIFIQSKQNYLLQRAKENMSVNFATELHGIKVEGSCVDLLRFYEYIKTQNLWSGETLRSLCIYCKDEVILKELHALFRFNYNPGWLVKQYIAWLKRERKVHTKNFALTDIKVKYIVENIHLANVVNFLFSFPGEIPPNGFLDVFNKVKGSLSEEFQREIDELFQQRKRDRDQEVEISGNVKKYLKECEEKEKDCGILEAFKKNESKMEELEDLFLKYVGKYGK